MGKAQVLSEVQVASAPLLAPVSSWSASGVVLTLFAALFQLVFATTPALSEAPIAAPLPTKLMLTTRAETAPAVAVKLAVWLELIMLKVWHGGVKVYPSRECETDAEPAP